MNIAELPREPQAKPVPAGFVPIAMAANLAVLRIALRLSQRSRVPAGVVAAHCLANGLGREDDAHG